MTRAGTTQPTESAALDMVRRVPMREVIPIEPGSSFRFYLHDDPHPYISWGYHPEYEVHLIVNTSGRYVIGDVIDAFDPGHLVIVGPNLPHHWISELARGETAPNAHAVLHFGDPWIRACQSAMPELHSLDTLLRRSEHGLEFAGETARLGAAAMTAIADATEGMERLVRVIELLRILATAPPTEQRTIVREWAPRPDDPAAARLVGNAIDYILENLSADVRLSEAAYRAAMSESAFSRYFKSASGSTFTDMVRQLRLTRARWLLERTDERIASIASTVGYSNLSNFNRQFLRAYGMTPREYRRAGASGAPGDDGHGGDAGDGGHHQER